MKKVIHHLRKQPEEVRRHVLHLSMIVITAIMFGLWILSLGKSLGNAETADKIKEDLKPFSELKEDLVERYNQQ